MILAIDCETFGLDWKDPAQGVFGIAIAHGGIYKYFDIRVDDCRDEINSLMAKADKIVNHNIKFDVHMLLSAGFDVPVDKCECTSIRAALINEHEPSMSLDALAKKYLNQKKDVEIYDKLAELFGGKADRKTQIQNLHRAPPELVAKYAKKDAEVALLLWRYQETEIEKQDLRNIFELEKRLFPVLIDMERGGVRIDTERAFSAIDTLSIKVSQLKAELHKKAGFQCNYNPSGDIIKLFSPRLNDNGEWVLRDGTLCEKTPTGKPKIGSEVLKRMSDPCAAIILALRKLTKTRDTFLNGHIVSNLHNGKLHANINQVVNEAWGKSEGTKTGRFSMSRPALQQIPARDKEISAILRPLFIPDDGEVWLSIDYRQFEFRIFAHYVKNDTIIKLFHENPDIDFHQLVADIANIPRNAKESGGPNAKQVNLGMVMGMGAGKMAKEMRMPYTVEKVKQKDGSIKERIIPGEAALDVLNKYHEAIPGVREMQRAATIKAEARGYVFTLAKRRIHYPDRTHCYKAASNIYQGGAADCLKQKLIEIHALLKKEGRGRILLSVHDEINLSVPNDPALINRIVACMENFDGVECPISLRIPIRTDPGVGVNWGDASGK